MFLVWCLLAFIGLICFLIELFTWFPDGGARANIRDWKIRGESIPDKIKIHTPIALFALIMMLSPFFFERVGGDYAVVNKDGMLIKMVLKTNGTVIRQSSWDRQIAGGDPVLLDACAVNMLAEYKQVWIRGGENDHGQYRISITGDDSYTNLVKRACEIVKNGFPHDDGSALLVKKAVTASPSFPVIKKCIDDAIDGHRELTITEKAEIYGLLSTIDSTLWEKYGLRIVDIWIGRNCVRALRTALALARAVFISFQQASFQC